MNKLSSIRSLLALMLLLVLALAATPKRYLHDLVTHHNHASAKNNNEKAAVDVAGFSCQYDQVVVTETFTITPEEIWVNAPCRWFAQYPCSNYSFAPTYTSLTLTLRGPPSFKV